MITAIIPNWNGERHLPRVLEDLARQTVKPAQVFVIDNGSTDNSAAIAAKAGAALIRRPENRGFANAVNAGIGITTTPMLAILNNDVRLDPDYLEQLQQALIGDETLYFATGKVFKIDTPGILDATFDAVARSACALRCGNGQPDGPEFQTVRRIYSAPLTAALFRRSLFHELGPLDEGFESYLEDVDLGLRCAGAGKQGVFLPSAIARHQGSATLGEWHPDIVRLISRNQVLLVAKHFPEDWPLRYGWPVLIGQVLWGVVAFKHGCGSAWLRGKLDGIQRFSDFRPRINTRNPSLSEDLIRSLRPNSFYWRTYFGLT